MQFLIVGGFVLTIMGVIVIPMAVITKAQADGIQEWLKANLGTTGLVLAVGVAASIDLARWITNKLGANFKGIERLTIGWMGGLYQYVERVGAMTLLWPLELFKVTYWLIWHEIPRMVKALPNAVSRVVHQTVTRVVRVERTIVKLPKLTKAQAKALIGAAVATYIAPYLSMLRWLRSHYHALTAVLPHVAPIPIGRTIAGIRARLRKLEKAGVGTIAVAALVAALARMKLGFLRCGNFRKAGNRVCGMNLGLLESLLLDTVAIVGTISILELAHELLSVEDQIVRGVKLGFRELRDIEV